MRLALLVLALGAPTLSPAADDWLRVDYSALVDTRRLSHSGESVEVLLQRLGGRPLPVGGERGADRLAHVLLDPLLEPYAFVLIDAADALFGVADPPRLEVGSLWRPAEAQPAWVELLRARRLVLESDGRGRVRLFAPWDGEPGASGAALPARPAEEAAAEAWRAARPVVRLALAAERRRLAGLRGEPVELQLTVLPYVHYPARLQFHLGARPYRAEITDTAVSPGRSPVDLGRLRAFLERRTRLEGARLEADGSLTLLESARGRRSALLGSPITLADLAVAYRAVFHGGAAEPYMSLDRAPSPHMTLVNYGGRLRDTRLGWVSLLCDIRFKTLDLGLGLYEDTDLRPDLDRALPGFLTHRERFARSPGSRGVVSEQIRLWFYPEDVDLTVSAEGDVLAMRRVRMTARSEKVEEDLLRGARAEDPPWTRATIVAINEGYDRLAARFPELEDLDDVVRLLSLFTWLRAAEARGLATPDLDLLLDAELPSTPTPRVLPRLLTFLAMPQVNDGGELTVLDRIDVATALERLRPVSGRALPAPRRFARARAGLNPRVPDQRGMLRQLAGIDVAELSDSALDVLSYRAERLRMHQTVLTSLPPERRDSLLARERAGEPLRVFSVGIGGIDLGMQQAIDRSSAASLRLVQTEVTSPGGPQRRPGPSGPAPAGSAGEEGSQEATGTAGTAGRDGPELPPHGIDGNRAGFVVERGETDEALGRPQSWLRVYGADGPEVRVHRTFVAEGRAVGFERYEEGRPIGYRFRRRGDGLVAEAVPSRVPIRLTGDSPAPLPEGLAALRLSSAADDGPAPGPRDERVEPSTVAVTLEKVVDGELREFSSRVARADMQQAVLELPRPGRPTDPLANLFPLPEWLGPTQALMLISERPGAGPVWESGPLELPGEEDPRVVAWALAHRFEAGAESRPGYPTVIGTDRRDSPRRWSEAPAQPGRATILLLPEDGFPAPFESLRAALSRVWTAGPVLAQLPERMPPAKRDDSLVVLVSAEAPASFARRLRALAGDARMAGRALAAWSLAAPLRGDLPGSLLAGRELACIGVAEASAIGVRSAERRLAEWSRRLAATPPRSARIETLGGPFVWVF